MLFWGTKHRGIKSKCWACRNYREIIFLCWIWMNEYCFTSLSAQLWQYRDRRKPEAGTMPYSYFKCHVGHKDGGGEAVIRHFKQNVTSVQKVNEMKWNESGFRPPLCTYRLNWARRASWGWWDDWDDTVLQTQDSKFEPWRSEAEHATSWSRRLPDFHTWMGKKHFLFLSNHRDREPNLELWRERQRC